MIAIRKADPIRLVAPIRMTAIRTTGPIHMTPIRMTAPIHKRPGSSRYNNRMGHSNAKLLPLLRRLQQQRARGTPEPQPGWEQSSA